MNASSIIHEVTDVKLAKQTRRDKAKTTRTRIVQRAYELFCEQGYASTTMEAIANSAQVATQTVYYIFGTKARLLQEVTEVAAAGEDEPPPVMERAWMIEAFSEADPRRGIALAVEHGVDIYDRVARLGPALRAAASIDPDVEAYWRGVTEARRQGMSQFIASLAERGSLREGRTVAEAGDIHFVLHSHETFLGFTRGCAWSTEDYKAWLYQTLCQQLLRDDPDVALKYLSPTRGLSFDHVIATASSDQDSMEHR